MKLIDATISLDRFRERRARMMLIEIKGFAFSWAGLEIISASATP